MSNDRPQKQREPAEHPVTNQYGDLVGWSRTPHWARAEKHPLTGEVYLRRASDPVVERPKFLREAPGDVRRQE